MDVQISSHAIDRFRERTGCKKSEEYITNKLKNMLNSAKEAEFVNGKYAVMAILNHDMTCADYYIYNNWVFVIVNSELRTVHNNESKRWRLKCGV